MYLVHRRALSSASIFESNWNGFRNRSFEFKKNLNQEINADFLLVFFGGKIMKIGSVTSSNYWNNRRKTSAFQLKAAKQANAIS